jgi:hypothetical protein
VVIASGQFTPTCDTIAALALHEREFYNEKQEPKPATFTCPRYRRHAEYQVRWIRRTKKDRVPSGTDERDGAMFAKRRDYLIRLDDELVCNGCKRKFGFLPSNRWSFSDPAEIAKIVRIFETGNSPGWPAVC